MAKPVCAMSGALATASIRKVAIRCAVQSAGKMYTHSFL